MGVQVPPDRLKESNTPSSAARSDVPWRGPLHLTMAEHYMDDFDAYSKLFRKHSIRVIELMKMMQDKMQLELGQQEINRRDLYKMVHDLMYAVDNTYKQEKGIKDSFDSFVYPFMSKDEVWAEMRTMLQQELDRYFHANDK